MLSPSGISRPCESESGLRSGKAAWLDATGGGAAPGFTNQFFDENNMMNPIASGDAIQALFKIPVNE